MLVFYEIFIITISVILMYISIKSTIKNRGIIYLVHLLFCFVYVVPIILDYLIGYPSYSSSRYYGFIISYRDELTRFLYSTFVLVSQIIILVVGGNKLNSKNQKYKIQNNSDAIQDNPGFLKENNKYYVFLFWFASILTVALVLILPIQKNILLHFGWREQGTLIEGQKYYSTVERLSYISILSAIILLFNFKTNVISKGILVLLIILTMNVQAKRSILLFIAIVIFSILLFNAKMNRKKWVYVFGLFCLAIGVYYSIYIKITYRNYIRFETIYTTLRIDFFRDDTVKMVIYSLINPNEMKILQYPGQSIITQIGSLFPLQFLGVKVIGFNSYLTAALMRNSYVDPTVNWITTSIFDEMLANFGFLGIIIAATILGKIAKIADSQNRKLIPITVSVACLLLMYSPNYIMWFIQFWILVVVFDKLNIRKSIKLFQGKLEK